MKGHSTLGPHNPQIKKTSVHKGLMFLARNVLEKAHTHTHTHTDTHTHTGWVYSLWSYLSATHRDPCVHKTHFSLSLSHTHTHYSLPLSHTHTTPSFFLSFSPSHTHTHTHTHTTIPLTHT